MADVKRLDLIFPKFLHALSMVQKRLGRGLSHNVRNLPNALCYVASQEFSRALGAKSF